MDNIQKFKSTLLYKSHLNCEECAKKSGNQNLADKFVELSCDDETELFIETCIKSKFQLFKATYIRPWLLHFYTLPEANGIMGTGKMFMLSTNQLSILFDGETFENMLDIGAGDGHVTNQFRSIIRGNITCTESCEKLIKVLNKNGYTTQNEIEGDFELISCLNVLDRCDRPISILKSIQRIKKKFVIISIVLPFRGFYYNGNKKCPQLESLIDYYKNWEENVNILCKTFVEMGFEIEKISRVPYLSEGDNKRQCSWLDTAVFILS